MLLFFLLQSNTSYVSPDGGGATGDFACKIKMGVHGMAFFGRFTGDT